MRLKTLVVDDEPLAREGLRAWLEQDPEVASIRECGDGREAIAAIQAESPDLVFLDVQMPEMDGLSVVRHLGEAMPELVFVTAHDEYAMLAFEINAIDYLLKPVTAARFQGSLARAKRRLAGQISQNHADSRILSLLEALASPHKPPQRLAVHASGATTFVEVNDIQWIRAAENYVEVHVAGGSYLVRVAINRLERALDPASFLRIHRSLIVRCKFISKIQQEPHGEYRITLSDGSSLRSGRAYRDRIKAFSKNPF